MTTNSEAALIRGKESRVGELFFSNMNKGVLHEAIRYSVWKESEKMLVIGRQSDAELSIVMRSIYLSDARNVDDSRECIIQQVKELNTNVLNYCVPQIVREGEMYRRYTLDASSLPIPLERGQISTTKGDRTLDLTPLYKI